MPHHSEQTTTTAVTAVTAGTGNTSSSKLATAAARQHLVTSVALFRHVLLLRQGVVGALGFELHLGSLRTVSSWGLCELVGYALLGYEVMIVVAMLGQRAVHVVHYHPVMTLGTGPTESCQLWVEGPQVVSTIVGVVKPVGGSKSQLNRTTCPSISIWLVDDDRAVWPPHQM